MDLKSPLSSVLPPANKTNVIIVVWALYGSSKKMYPKIRRNVLDPDSESGTLQLAPDPETDPAKV